VGEQQRSDVSDHQTMNLAMNAKASLDELLLILLEAKLQCWHEPDCQTKNLAMNAMVVPDQLLLTLFVEELLH
jgi:hypothetical protein